MTVHTMFLGALMHGSRRDASDVLALVRDRDLATPSQETIAVVIRKLVTANRSYTPELVLAEVQRLGKLSGPVQKELLDATTSGATALALRDYASAVVAEALRRRVDSAGTALTAAAREAAEPDLAPIVARAVAAVDDCADRLRTLRGGVE